MNDKILTLACIALLFSACSQATEELSASERGSLSTLMINLSSAVDTYFSTLATAPSGTDADILAQATKPDPSLLAPEFKDYQLNVQYQQQHAIVLLCTKDGSRALIEDVGCSARVDHQINSASPCEFTLKVSQDCKVEGGDPQ